jgi:hypothetical protein
MDVVSINPTLSPTEVGKPLSKSQGLADVGTSFTRHFARTDSNPVARLQA